MCTLLGNLILIVLVCMTRYPHVQPSPGVGIGRTRPVYEIQRKALDGVAGEKFLDQKDALLDMLEKKLKEASVNKKKKRLEDKVPDPARCEPVPDNVDVKIQANGVNSVGDIDLLLKLGQNGKDTLRLEASGISNVGKTNLEMGMPNKTFNIPGLYDLFSGSNSINRCKLLKTESGAETEPSEAPAVTQDPRRAEHIDVDKSLNEVAPNKEKTEDSKTEATINNTISTNHTAAAVHSANDTVLSANDNGLVKLSEDNTDGGKNENDAVDSSNATHAVDSANANVAMDSANDTVVSANDNSLVKLSEDNTDGKKNENDAVDRANANIAVDSSNATHTVDSANATVLSTNDGPVKLAEDNTDSGKNETNKDVALAPTDGPK